MYISMYMYMYVHIQCTCIGWSGYMYNVRTHTVCLLDRCKAVRLVLHFIMMLPWRSCVLVAV